MFSFIGDSPVGEIELWQYCPKARGYKCLKMLVLLSFKCGKATDQKMTAVEKIFCYIHRSQEEGSSLILGRATWGSTSISQEAGGEGESG